MLTPRWVLLYSPLEVTAGESREGMDLMRALAKGAGVSTDSIDDDNTTRSPKAARTLSPKQLLTDEEIFGNVFIITLAGHATTANIIHFWLLFLAMHPPSQRRLQRDLDDIVGDKPISEWDYDEDVPKLFGSMCGAVMYEQLRSIVPVVGIPKSTNKGSPQVLQLNGQHLTVSPDCYISLCMPALHRNPNEAGGRGPGATEQADGTEEDLEFDGPHKQADVSAALFRPAKGAYVLFSDGYRSCLGRHFAQVEVLVVLAAIFKT